MSTKPQALAVLAVASRQCSGDRALVYELLLQAVVEFACQSVHPNEVIRMGIQALTAALEAGERAAAAAGAKPS